MNASITITTAMQDYSEGSDNYAMFVASGYKGTLVDWIDGVSEAESITRNAAYEAIAAAEFAAAAAEMSVPAAAAAEMSVPAAAAAVTWCTKSGKSITRHSPIGAMSAPKSTQVSSAIDATMAQWRNGQFKPFTRDVRANLSDKQALAIADKCTLSPANKSDSAFFLECALYELTHKTVKNIVLDVTPKGEKSRIVSTINAILE